MVNCYYNHGLNYGNITKEQPTNQYNMFVRTDLNNNNHQPTSIFKTTDDNMQVGTPPWYI